MIVKFKKLKPDVEIPKYQTPDSSGFDLAAAEDVTIPPGSTKVIPTGLACELFKVGRVLYELQIRPRGGTSLKTPLRIANSPGTVDVDYRGEIGIVAWNPSDSALHIPKGERIAQGVICPIVRCDILLEVDELTTTERGTGAYGSTGE